MYRERRNELWNLLPIVGVILVVLAFRGLSRSAGREEPSPAVPDALAAVIAGLKFATTNSLNVRYLQQERARAMPMLVRQLSADETVLKKIARDSLETVASRLGTNAPALRAPVELRRAAAWGLLSLMEQSPATAEEREILWPAVTGALRDADQLVRSTAAAIPLFFHDDADRVIAFCELAAKDSQHFVRHSAARSVVPLARTNPRARALLESLTNDLHSAVREQAELELRFIHGRERASTLDQPLSRGGSFFE